MTLFPAPIIAYWDRVLAGDRKETFDDLSCAVGEGPSVHRPAMMLEQVGTVARAVVRPEIAENAGIADQDGLSKDGLKSRLRHIGLVLHDPDYLFYRPVGSCPDPGPNRQARRLTDEDRAVFHAFDEAASEQDRDDAWVELDHWAVFGCFDGGRLVSAASLNLWDDSPIADIGVLTLPHARGKGFARAVVLAANGYAQDHGREPQYRCQRDNAASVALARSCGLALFGEWTVATDRPGVG